ncbi:hypothetical protein ABH925_007408 [Streptacidiphilus sp. EB129]
MVQNPKQWKAPSGLITAVPVFRGFPDQQVPSTPVTSLDIGSEAYARMEAAALTKSGPTDVLPDPAVWS